MATDLSFERDLIDKTHEVVIALEFTAAVTANEEIFKATRHARHSMDISEPWKFPEVGRHKVEGPTIGTTVPKAVRSASTPLRLMLYMS